MSEDEEEAQETPTASPAWDDFETVELVIVARAVKVRGVRGEVAAELLTDFPERFEWLDHLIAVGREGRRQLLALEESWPHGGRVVLKFEGYDTPEQAAALVGLDFAVPESEAVELEDDEFYDWQLEGCRAVTVEGRELGTVREVMHTGSAPILVISGEPAAQGREHLVPLVESICVEIDIERKLIRIDAPEGLLEDE
ncbi:MAG TPA: ribosome maturation factor RimM [Pyrinomonadaceae bacterium]|nr:ribosome maturation factor RimM [Pyrinomonadaceae bacterium]